MSASLGGRSLWKNVVGRQLLRLGGATLLTFCVAAPSIAFAKKPRSKPKSKPELTETVGPIEVSAIGRLRVRGFRPDGSSVHVSHAPRSYQPNALLMKSLERFERVAFPLDASLAPFVRDVSAELPDDLKGLTMPDIPVRWTPKLISYLRYLTEDKKGKGLMKAWLKRLGRYESTIRPIFKSQGIPEDLIFVALAESGFNPRVKSRVGAGGLWQFMGPTGRVYGLDASYWEDGRFDIQKSSFAAAAYLRDLKVRFGSWELALSAYNAGYGLVSKAIARSNTNDFWALCEIENGLPFATTNYPPKILAASIVARNRDRFGFTDDVVNRMPAAVLVPVDVPPKTKLSELAKTIGVDSSKLLEFNAQFIRGRTPPTGDSATVWIPKSSVAKFNSLKGKIASLGHKYALYEVVLGDDLELIARQYGLKESALRTLNGIDDGGEVTPGLTLVVPKSPVSVTPSESQKPLAAVPSIDVPQGHRLIFFRVTRASRPQEIAGAFGVDWLHIVKWNKLDERARLRTNQMLQIVVPDSFKKQAQGVRHFEKDAVRLAVRGSAEHLEMGLADRGLLRRAYKVRSGDTLAKIGKRFALSAGSVARINSVSIRHQPKKGERLIVYVTERTVRYTIKAPAPKNSQRLAEAVAVESIKSTKGRRDASTASTSKLPGQERLERDEGEDSK